MKKLIVIVVLKLVVLCTYPTLAAHTLNEVLEYTYQNNPHLKSVREQVRVTDESVMQALSGFLPSANANGVISSTKGGRWSTGVLAMSQNLFRGGRDIASIKQAKHSVKRSNAFLISQEQEIIAKTVDIYMKTLQTFEVYQISRQSEADAKKYLIGIKSRFVAGQNTKADVAQAEASAVSARAFRAKSHSEYTSMKAVFVKITGLEPKKLLPPKDNVKLPKTLELAISESVSSNPLLISAKAEHMMAQEGTAANVSSLLPSVDLKYLNRKSSTENQLFANTSNDSQVTLDISVPIFNGGYNWSKIRQSVREEKSKEYSIEDIKNGVIQNTTSVWVSLKSAKAILEARKQEVKASRTAYEGFLAEEKVGFRDTIDVINIRKQYFNASIAVLAARSEYYNSIYQLKAQLGECTPKGLGLKVTY